MKSISKDSVKTKIPNKPKKAKLLKRMGFILLGILLVPVFLFFLGWFSRDLLIDELQAWYERNSNGKLEIGHVDATFFYGFPNVGFTINDLYQTSFDTILDKRTSVFIDKALVSIAATDLLTGDIQFRKINIHNAIFHSKVITEKSQAEYRKLKLELAKVPGSGLQFPIWLHPERTNFDLQNISLVIQDSILNKFFDIKIQQARGKLRATNDSYLGNLEFKAFVKDLGFNTKKGSFINGAIFRGNPSFEMSLEDDQIMIPEFDLKIGEELFKISADFSFENTSRYNFSLKNDDINFQSLKKFLPDSISAKIARYHINEPIKTDLQLKGEFKYGNIPWIDGNFSTRNNSARLGDSLEIQNIQFRGFISNNLNRGTQEGPRPPTRPDIKIFFEDFSGNIEDIKIKASEAYFESSEETASFLNASVNINGSNETLADVLQNENFSFIGGDFKLNVELNGDISSNSEIFSKAQGDFIMRDSRVVLKENNLQLPVEILRLKLEKGNSILQNLVINLPDDENLIFSGSLKNASSLVSEDIANPTSTYLLLESDELNLNRLINTATEFSPNSEGKKNNQKTLNETFEAIYNKFRPQFQINLKALKYNEMAFNDVAADVRLINQETIFFDHFNFNYKQAITSLTGTVKVPEPGEARNEPIFIDVQTLSSGPISVFQELFNIELIDINAGTYTFEGAVTGDIQKFEQILNNATGDLQLTNAEFYYPNADSNIGLDSLKISVDKSNILVNRFEIKMEDHYPFGISAKIEDFPGFLMDDLENTGSIDLSLDAKYVDMDQWIETIGNIENKETNTVSKKASLIKVFKDINEFNPEFKLAADSLKIRDLISKNINAHVFFENDSVLKLDDLNLYYGNTKTRIFGSLTANELQNTNPQQNPFNFDISAEIKGKNRDLNDFLKTVNFVFLSGDFEFLGNYQGEAGDLEIMNSDFEGSLSLGRSKVDIPKANLQIPLDSLHLNITNNIAYLDRLDVNLPGKSSLDINGTIDNFSEFINNNQNSHRSTFTIESPYLSTADIEKFLSEVNKEKDSSELKTMEIQNLKDILAAIHSSYYPSVTLGIDSLTHKKLSVSNFSSNIGFKENGDFRLENTHLNYRESIFDLNIEAEVSNSENLPVRIQMEAQAVDLEKLIKDLDYFNDSQLREADSIGGKLNYTLDASGILEKKGKVDLNSLNGTLKIAIDSLSLYNYQPILDNLVLMKEERFKKLRFRPIRQTFTIENGKIRIPRTEIQSTALHLFVEGDVKLDEYVNIWLSLPWKNLKTRDGLILPEKTTFDDAGAKFYIQLIQDKNSDKSKKQNLKSKFRLWNGKLEKSFEN